MSNRSGDVLWLTSSRYVPQLLGQCFQVRRSGGRGGICGSGEMRGGHWTENTCGVAGLCLNKEGCVLSVRYDLGAVDFCRRGVVLVL